MAPNENSLVASPCGINGDVSRDTPALAFGVNYSVFKEPLSDTEAAPTGVPSWKVRKRRTDTHLSPRSARHPGSEEPRVGPARGVRVNASGAEHRGRTRDCMGRIANLQPARPIFVATGLASPPMGSSGMKRKGRKHQPKVGTKQERDYALHQDQRAVAANMGVSGKGAMFWIAIVVIVALVVVAVLGLALLLAARRRAGAVLHGAAEPDSLGPSDARAGYPAPR